MKYKNKNIKLKGRLYTLTAVALEVPSREVAININFKRNIFSNQVIAEEIEIKKKIKNWFEESTVLHPNHFISVVEGPTSYKRLQHKPKQANFSFAADISVCTRKVIKEGATHFEEVVMSCLEDLVEVLELKQ
jgi:hypothetical protein